MALLPEQQHHVSHSGGEASPFWVNLCSVMSGTFEFFYGIEEKPSKITIVEQQQGQCDSGEPCGPWVSCYVLHVYNYQKR